MYEPECHNISYITRNVTRVPHAICRPRRVSPGGGAGGRIGYCASYPVYYTLRPRAFRPLFARRV